MSRTLMFAAAAATVLTFAACNKKPAETKGAATPAEQAATPNANPAATIPTPANEAKAPDFVAKAAGGDMFEVQAGKMAATKAVNPEAKKFARMMVDAHTKTTEGLKAAIASSGQTLVPPAALPSDLQGKLDDLGKKSGADFDKAYMDAMVDAHQINPDHNWRRCFPQYFTLDPKNPATGTGWGWFHKYLASSVTETDLTGEKK